MLNILLTLELPVSGGTLDRVRPANNKDHPFLIITLNPTTTKKELTQRLPFLIDWTSFATAVGQRHAQRLPLNGIPSTTRRRTHIRRASGLQMSRRMLGQPLRDRLVRHASPLRVVKLALVPVGALFPVRTGWRRIAPSHPQEVVQRWAGPAERVVRGHEAIVHERVHQHPLFDHLLELGTLLHQVAVVVIRNHDAVIFCC